MTLTGNYASVTSRGTYPAEVQPPWCALTGSPAEEAGGFLQPSSMLQESGLAHA